MKPVLANIAAASILALCGCGEPALEGAAACPALEKPDAFGPRALTFVGSIVRGQDGVYTVTSGCPSRVNGQGLSIPLLPPPPFSMKNGEQTILLVLRAKLVRDEGGEWKLRVSDVDDVFNQGGDPSSVRLRSLPRKAH